MSGSLPLSIKLQFSTEDWERVRRDWLAWWAGELDRPIVVIDSPVPSLARARWFTAEFGLDTPVDEVLDHYQTNLEARRFFGDAYPRYHPNLGPGVLAAFLGAEVHPAEGVTVWFSPLSKGPISDLHLGYDPHNLWWRRAQEIIGGAAQRWGSRVTVGMTGLGGNLDTLASLRTTQQLLFDLLDTPEEVDRLVGEITRLWLRYYEELRALMAPEAGMFHWADMWCPGRTYMLQCDLSVMLSPRMFERFVLPDLAACCQALDFAFYHLDGEGQIPHLDMLLALERLRGVQWVPSRAGPPPEECLPLLQRIRANGKLCQLFVSSQGALKIVRELGGKGFAFSIREKMDEADAQDLLRTLAAGDAGRLPAYRHAGSAVPRPATGDASVGGAG